MWFAEMALGITRLVIIATKAKKRFVGKRKVLHKIDIHSNTERDEDPILRNRRQQTPSQVQGEAS
jgi:hypothetical protein